MKPGRVARLPGARQIEAMLPYSLLDLSPVREGFTVSDALADSLTLARAAEAAGYTRFWLAEHHGMPGIASAATAVVIGHVAQGTKTIRVGAGGIMLPNHSPLVIAEQFGTLEALFPGRIDLGLGRAPGTDMATARALRRGLQDEEDFPQSVMELIHYLDAPHPDARVRACPGEGAKVPVWILGSSLYGAQLAAWLGLPYAFASHFAPAALEEAAATYRTTFRPSAWAERPHFMMAIGLVVAETDAQADLLRSSQLQSFARLRSGQPGRLPPPRADLSDIPAIALQQAAQAMSCAAVGSPTTVKDRLAALIARHQPDEVIFAGAIFDPEARIESFARGAEVMQSL
jgi:luciferase family oxidoreductase group 1